MALTKKQRRRRIVRTKKRTRKKQNPSPSSKPNQNKNRAAKKRTNKKRASKKSPNRAAKKRTNKKRVIKKSPNRASKKHTNKKRVTKKSPNRATKKNTTKKRATKKSVSKKQPKTKPKKQTTEHATKTGRRYANTFRYKFDGTNDDSTYRSIIQKLSAIQRRKNKVTIFVGAKFRAKPDSRYVIKIKGKPKFYEFRLFDSYENPSWIKQTFGTYNLERVIPELTPSPIVRRKSTKRITIDNIVIHEAIFS